MSKQAYTEIERKYLIERLPFSLSDYPFMTIRQGYISYPEDHVTLRVRDQDGIQILTIKQAGENGRILRREVEMQIPEKEARPLWEMAGQRSIKKTRYLIPWNNKKIELDIFGGSLEGFMMAEIEFDSEEESMDFPVPDWFGRELTEDFRYTNSNLAFYGLPD